MGKPAKKSGMSDIHDMTNEVQELMVAVIKAEGVDE